MTQQTLIPPRPTPWKHVIIVCRKCGKKLKGGFGPKRKKRLKSVLREALRDDGRRRDVRVFETACMGVCPKHGVTVLNAGRPGLLHVIPAGTDGNAALTILLGDHPVAERIGVEPG